MLDLVDIIKIQMEKNNINSLAELCRKCEEIEKGRKFYVPHMTEILKGRNVQMEYLYTLEKLFKLPQNYLVNLADLRNIKTKNMRGSVLDARKRKQL